MAQLIETAKGLEVRADYEEVGAIRSQYVDEMTGLAMLLEPWLCNGWTLCEASDLGGLSEAPVLSPDMGMSDAGEYEVYPGGKVYAFMAYQVRGVLDDIARKGAAIFEKVGD